MPGIYDFTAQSLAGEEVPLKRFEGQVLLIVNTASACGFTPQYKGLESCIANFAPRGFAVLGFPCNQFGGQEPGDAKQIAGFCETNFDVTFPMFAKIDVNGSKAHPLFNHLKNAKIGLLGSSIKWNFTKFLVDRSGKVVGRYAPTATPEGTEKRNRGTAMNETKSDERRFPTVSRPIRTARTTMPNCFRATSASASRAPRRPMSRNTASARAGFASPPATPRTATATR